MRNPFKFGKEVTGYQFYDRAEDSRILHQKLLDGSSNVVLFAPRRYGKTSLVLKVLRDLSQRNGVKGVCFDMSRVQTLERFCRDYVQAVMAAIGGGVEFAHRALSLLKHLHPELSLEIGGSFRVQLRFNPSFGTESIAEVLDLPERLMASSQGAPLVVAFDEFQEVGELSGEFPLEKIFRSCIQSHQHVHYVFVGSKPYMMKRMFGDQTRPFYNSASPLPLKKPPREESVGFLVSRFGDAGIMLSTDVAEQIVRASDNIPYYLQAMASDVFDVRQGNDGEVTPQDVENAAADIVGRNAELYDVRMEGFSAAKRLLLRALAEEPTKVFDEDYRTRHGLPVASTLHTALRELVDAGVVDQEVDEYVFVDPSFARYIREPIAKIIRSEEV